jgi:hypothetical protein
LAAGPLLADYADQGLESGIAWLASWAPGFLRPYLPKPLEGPSSSPRESRVAAPATSAPVAEVPAKTAQAPAPPKPAVEASAQRPAARAPSIVAMATPAASDRPAPPPQARRARGSHRRVTDESAEAGSSLPVATSRPAERKSSDHSDPFESEGRRAVEPGASERTAKAAAEPSPTKSRPARGGGSLDDLMADVATGSGSASKDRRNTSKEIDAMLKDVQKSDPPPPPKRAEPAALPPLTASDIAKVMGGVKTGASACGRRFGQNGVADLRLTVGKDGRVSDVALRGKLAGSPIARCISEAVRGATFPRNSGLKFDYRIDVQ